MHAAPFVSIARSPDQAAPREILRGPEPGALRLTSNVGQPRIRPLEEKLIDNRHWFLGRPASAAEHRAITTLALEIDGDASYGIVRPILATASFAGYERVYVRRVPPE